MQWDNEPEMWQDGGGRLHMAVEGGTDCWRVTAHDFVADDAHFYHRPIEGDFVATATVRGDYTSKYDQAGLLVRESPTVWLKTGIEFVEGHQRASTVITREFSDWSIAPLDGDPDSVWVRVERTDETIETYLSTDGREFTRYRQGYLTEGTTLQVGPYAAAPTGEGFEVTIEAFSVE